MGNHKDKIEDLIEATEDPTQRATLLVLSSIDGALGSNTAATQEIAQDFRDHREEFRQHVIDEQKMMASVRGAWWAGLIFIGAIQILVAFILSRYVLQNDAQDARISDLEKRLIILEYAIKYRQ